MLTTSKASSCTSFTETGNCPARVVGIQVQCVEKVQEEISMIKNIEKKKTKKLRLIMRILNCWHWFPLPELRQIYWDTLERMFSL